MKAEAQLKTLQTKSKNQKIMHGKKCESLQRKIDSNKSNLQLLRHKHSDSRAEVRECRRKIMKQEDKLSKLHKDHDELLAKFTATVYELKVLQAECRNTTLASFRQEVAKLQQKVRDIKKAELAIQVSRQKTKSLHRVDKFRAKTRITKTLLISQIEKLKDKIEASKDIQYRRELEARVRELEQNDRHNQNQIQVLKEQVTVCVCTRV